MFEERLCIQASWWWVQLNNGWLSLLLHRRTYHLSLFDTFVHAMNTFRRSFSRPDKALSWRHPILLILSAVILIVNCSALTHPVPLPNRYPIFHVYRSLSPLWFRYNHYCHVLFDVFWVISGSSLCHSTPKLMFWFLICSDSMLLYTLYNGRDRTTGSIAVWSQ